MSEHDEIVVSESDKELNFDNLRKKAEAAEASLAEKDAEIARLRAYEFQSVVTEAGFAPTTGEGKSLIRDVTAGVITPNEGEELAVAVARHAESEYGWKPQAQRTPEQRVVETQAQRFAELQSSTTSDGPPQDWQQEAAEAEADGDWNKAVAIKMNQVIANANR